MDVDAIRGERLARQRLLDEPYPDITAVVGHLTAVQSQEFEDACRMLSRRVLGDPSLASIADQVATGDVVRTHVLRPTWHFVRTDDLDWMLDLTAERVHAQMRSQYRSAGFGDDRARAVGLVADVLAAASEPLTRREIGAELAERGLTITGQPLSQLTLAAELDKMAITGPRRGSWDTFLSYRSRIPESAQIDRDEAVATLARRYLDSHAPATAKDFAWWSGLTLTDARAGFAATGVVEVGDGLFSTGGVEASARGTAHLLSMFDEYVIAYPDRSACCEPGDFDLSIKNLVLVDGAVVGRWRIKRSRTKNPDTLEIGLYKPVSKTGRGLIDVAAQRLLRPQSTAMDIVVTAG
ncbi:MAG: winged helix DNA-binding domain-containing protein [Nakamurella sp.]